jgi:hypothetical protein
LEGGAVEAEAGVDEDADGGAGQAALDIWRPESGAVGAGGLGGGGGGGADEEDAGGGGEVGEGPVDGQPGVDGAPVLHRDAARRVAGRVGARGVADVQVARAVGDDDGGPGGEGVGGGGVEEAVLELGRAVLGGYIFRIYIKDLHIHMKDIYV